MKRNLVALAAAALLAGMVATDAMAAEHGGFGWPHGWYWRAADWRADDTTNFQSVYAVHCHSVARGARLAGKPWISISLSVMLRTEAHRLHP